MTRLGDERGHVTPAFVAAVGMTMLLLAIVANLLVLRYADGVLRAAVEEGVRQGLATASGASCEARVDAVVAAGLGPLAGQAAPPVCAVSPDGAEASISATFEGWLPVVPAHHASARASSFGLAVD